MQRANLPSDVLFIIKAPFQDEGAMWFCNDCATIEGALMANPHWANHIDVRRLAFPRPRHAIIALIGEENQGMPVLVLADSAKAPAEAEVCDGRAFLSDPKAITRYLAASHGGAGPHP
jgi:hypothetical protein